MPAGSSTAAASGDPYATAVLRAAVLDAWAASPDRFREDANSEEDLALGGYRDRLLVELLQNAADAAARAGVPGRVRVRLSDGTLSIANTGAPLTADGVRALASLRASAKRDGGTAGRFGVGFAAVLSASDAPAVLSTGGGVRFSAELTRHAVAGLAPVAGELARRSGAVPVLRLPFPEATPPADGFVTEVRLPLRATALATVTAALADVDPALLLALPALAEVDLAGRVLSRHEDGPDVVITDDGAPVRWRCATAAGELPGELLAERPTEERERGTWSVRWCVPVDDDGRPHPPGGRQVLHAPTPSDEPIGLRARLIATFPLDPDRRHVVDGPLTRWLVDRTAEVAADLVAGLAGHAAVLALVPPQTLGGSELDAALGAAVLALLQDRAWLPSESGDGPLTADRSCALEPELAPATTLLADVLPGLLPEAWAARSHRQATDRLGVRRIGTAAVVDAVAGLQRPARWWHDLYAALADLLGADRDALAALPVPLADGRLVTGAAGTLLPGPDVPDGVAAALDLRLVDRAAVHPLLERLGAQPASALAVLEQPATQDLVAASVDDADGGDDPAVLARAVLALVAAAGVRPGDLPWLSDLALPGADGEPYPAGELLLPGSPLAQVLVPDAPFGTVDPALVEEVGADALLAAGALRTFAVLTVADVDTADEAYDLDDGEQWLAAIGRGRPTVVEQLVAVRDLELVRDDAWPRALELLATLGAAVADDVTVRTLDGHLTAPSYTRWWLRRHPVLDGREPRRLRAEDAEELAGLYDVAPPTEPAVAELLGWLASVGDALADPDDARDLLGRLGDPDRRCPAALLPGVYARLAAALADDEWTPPTHVRVAPDRVAPARDVVLLDRPWLVPLLGGREVVPCALVDHDAVTYLLDVLPASEVVAGSVTSTPVRRVAWTAVPGIALAAQRLDSEVPAGDVTVHAGLTVDDDPVPWWFDDAGGHVDADAGPPALARVLSWQLGRWPLRAAATEALTQHGAVADRLRREDAAR